MESSLTSFFYKQNWMKVLRGLYVVGGQRSLRELARICNMPPTSVQEVVTKLVEANVLVKFSQSNKVFYSLNLETKEDKLLLNLIENENSVTLNKKAKLLSVKAKYIVDWIDETVVFLKKSKT